MAKQRIGWLDTARGLGIVLVVAGHGFSGPRIHPAVFKFHMPMFFMLSGMVFSVGPMRDLIGKRVGSLLVPYIAYLLIETAIDGALAHVEGRPPYLPLHSVTGTAGRMLYGGEALKGIYAIFWFPTVLFLTQLAANLLLLRLGKPRGGAWPVLMLASLALAYLIPHVPSPFAILVVAMALPLFVGGMVYAQHDLADTLPWWLDVAIVAAGLAGWFFVAPMDMKYQNYGTPVATMLVAVAITHLVCLLARAIDRVPALGALFARLGRASLAIMFLHLSFYYNLSRYLPEWEVFVIAIGGSWLFSVAAAQTSITGALFLGQRRRRPGPATLPIDSMATGG
jgi:fucose 4-O-acetylase-like acetyltransferase